MENLLPNLLNLVAMENVLKDFDEYVISMSLDTSVSPSFEQIDLWKTYLSIRMKFYNKPALNLCLDV